MVTIKSAVRLRKTFGKTPGRFFKEVGDRLRDVVRGSFYTTQGNLLATILPLELSISLY